MMYIYICNQEKERWDRIRKEHVDEIIDKAFWLLVWGFCLDFWKQGTWIFFLHQWSFNCMGYVYIWARSFFAMEEYA